MSKLQPVPWRGFSALQKLIMLVLPFIAAGFLALPFLDEALLRRLARLLNAHGAVAWLANSYGAWIIGGGLLLLWLVFVLWSRHRLVSDRQLWYGTGCPQCLEREMVRVSRKGSDRWYALLRVPAYRYACRNCTWRGLRIGRRELTPEHELELEQALMRFSPDQVGLPPVAVHHTEEATAVADGSPGSVMFRDAGDVGVGPAVESGEADADGATLDLWSDIDPEADDDLSPEDAEWIWRPPDEREG